MTFWTFTTVWNKSATSSADKFSNRFAQRREETSTSFKIKEYSTTKLDYKLYTSLFKGYDLELHIVYW